ncbi:MAG: hypothetical protein GY906_29185 [bacterium]|nr:hypothetical protein [bacterium]
MSLLLVLAIVFSAVVLTISVRLGAALAKIEDVGFGRATKLALALLALSIVCWSVAIWFDESGGPPGVFVIAFGPLLALPLIRRMLDATWPRSIVVWLAQGAGMVLCLLTVVTLLVPSGLIQNQAAPFQKQAMSEMRSLGIAVSAWAIDQDTDLETDSPTPESEITEIPQSTNVDLSDLQLIDMASLEPSLSPTYLSRVPTEDPWGTPYEVRIATNDNGHITSIVVRSAGADGSFSGAAYSFGSFDRNDTSQDIVWLDGFFVRSPNGFGD